MTSARTDNNTSFRRLQIAQGVRESLWIFPGEQIALQLCNAELFIIILEKPHTHTQQMKLKSVPILCSMLCVHWYIIAHLSVWFGEYEETHPPFYPAISAPTEKEIMNATVCRLCVCVCLCSSVVWCVCALSVFAKGVLWWWRALEISLYNPISFLIRWCCGGGGVKGEVELGALVKTFAPVLVLLIWLFRDSFGFSTGASCDQSSYPFHRSCRCVFLFVLTASEVYTSPPIGESRNHQRLWQYYSSPALPTSCEMFDVYL